LALSQDNRKIVVGYFVNWAPDLLPEFKRGEEKRTKERNGRNRGGAITGDKEGMYGEKEGRSPPTFQPWLRLCYTKGDSDVISFHVSIPAGFRRHLVGKTLRNVC